MPTSGPCTESFMAPCSTPPASGSSHSVSAQASRSTSLRRSWAITQRGPPISLPMGSTRRGSVTRRSGRSWRASGCLRHKTCIHSNPVRLPLAGGRAGVRRFIFLREEEGLEPVQTLVPIAANARKPKMTNAAPRIFLQKGRRVCIRCGCTVSGKPRKSCRSSNGQT